jgi:hypothetical protein
VQSGAAPASAFASDTLESIPGLESTPGLESIGVPESVFAGVASELEQAKRNTVARMGADARTGRKRLFIMASNLLSHVVGATSFLTVGA